MKKSLKLALFLAGVAPLPAMAHVDYTGQDFRYFHWTQYSFQYARKQDG